MRQAGTEGTHMVDQIRPRTLRREIKPVQEDRTVRRQSEGCSLLRRKLGLFHDLQQCFSTCVSQP